MGPNAVQGKAKRIEKEIAEQESKGKVWQIDKPPAEPSEAVKRLRFVLGNFGYFCTLLGYTMEDMLWLRALMMCSGVLTIGFAALHSPPIWIPIFWCCVFFTINFMYIMRLLADRKEVEFSGLALDAYESAFQAHGFTPRQFQRLMQEGKGAFLEVFEGDALVLQGDPLRKVVFLVSGEADLVIGGRRVAAIKGGNFATSLQCLLEASDAAAAKEVAKRVAERQAEEQDEDEDDMETAAATTGSTPPPAGEAAPPSSKATTAGAAAAAPAAAPAAATSAATPGDQGRRSGAGPHRRGKRRLRQEAWMAAAVGDESAGLAQSAADEEAAGSEGAPAPGPDTVDQHLLQPVAASLAAGRRFNRRASRRVLAAENDDWVGGDSAPKAPAVADGEEDELEMGEPEKLGDLLREAGHAFVEAGQAVGVLISEAVKERFQPSDEEDEEDEEDEDEAGDGGVSNHAATGGGAGAHTAAKEEAATATTPAASSGWWARTKSTHAESGREASRSGGADSPAARSPAAAGGAADMVTDPPGAAVDAGAPGAAGAEKPRKRKNRWRRREDIVEDETGGELGQDPEELAATARARQRERRREQRREDEQQRARKRLMGKRAGSSSQMALFVRETVHDAVEEELEELEEVQDQMARRGVVAEKRASAAGQQPARPAPTAQGSAVSDQAEAVREDSAKPAGAVATATAGATASPPSAQDGRVDVAAAGGSSEAQSGAGGGPAGAGSDAAVRPRHRRRRRHADDGAAEADDAEVSFRSATAFVEAAEGRGERTRRKTLERRRGAAAGMPRTTEQKTPAPVPTGDMTAEPSSMATADAGAAAAEAPPAAPAQGEERLAASGSAASGGGSHAKPAPQQRASSVHHRSSAHRATASVLVASPEATVIVWDLDAMRAVIEREKPMRFPAMSMVASEMASRLLLTTRSIERTYQYRKELQRRIHAGSGMLRDADREALQAWQTTNHVTHEEHEEALEAVGWTPSDFQAGWSASTAKVAAAKLRQRTGQGVRASMDWFTSRISGIIHQDASSPAASVRIGTPKPAVAPPEHRA